MYCPGKTCEQLLLILKKFHEDGYSVIGTRCSKEQFEFVQERGMAAHYNETSRIISYRADLRKAPTLPGKIAVCCAGTADLPIAEEAAQTAEFFGASVSRHFDVGIAGLHRLLSKIEEIRTANVVIAIAGMEGALASVISGLTDAPVIAVPTSVGYGASFNGIAPLLSMLNSCAEGMSVVNIDNGFGAALSACRILRCANKLVQQK
ncbi:MAG: nickel pincer cofactor biosynthesis protein LarB [Hallerella sp.]|nr:nickel pincer cofactor biosynthesis protein LarB [Hallerella sp.]